MVSQAPTPCEDEYPASFADRMGRWYAYSSATTHRKEFGQYLTPVEVARFMANSSSFRPQGNVVRVLDPGAGAGILSCAFCEMIAQRTDLPLGIELDAYEVDGSLADVLEMCLTYTKGWLARRQINLDFAIHAEDFVLAHAEGLEDSQLKFAISDRQPNAFDFAISNPPYFKLQKSDPRSQAALQVVHGQPNIYALFMAVTASLLKKGGEMCFITPRSFTAGLYFKLFREQYFRRMKPLAIHLFDSRREAFRRDEVLQENLILTARRSDGWWSRNNGDMVRISSSDGIRDLGHCRVRSVSLAEVLDFGSKDKVLRVPATEEDLWATGAIQTWLGNLRSYGLEISTGPVVPFRAVPVISHSGDVPATHAPFLWMQNVKPMRVEWPIGARGKPQYMTVSDASMPLLLPDRHYVIMRRFSSKEQHRRLTAAPLLKGALGSPLIGLENHLNYIYRPNGTLTEEEAYGLATLFNSSLLDTYFRTSNGNTQVNATELRMMPLPPQDIIRQIGRQAMNRTGTNESPDEIVESVLGCRRVRGLTEELASV